MKKLILPLALLLVTSVPAWAADTNVTVRVKSKDAMFIGDAAGGAYVIVRDKRDGDILVEGRTSGTSGDRAKVMTETMTRGASVTDDKTAEFEFSLDLYEPTPVSVEVSGPYGQRQSLAHASTDYILIPGKDYTKGDGIVVELPGFIVDVLSPPAAFKGKFSKEGTTLLKTNVAKLCGCNINEGSPWPPSRYEVEASIYRGDVFLAKVSLEKDKEPSIYNAALKFQEAGTYRVVVTAFDPLTLEGGVDSTTITLEP